MAKTKMPARFTAFDLKGKKKHEIPGVEKIEGHRLRRESWAITKPRTRSTGSIKKFTLKKSAAKKSATKKKSAAKKRYTKGPPTNPRSVAGVMRHKDREQICRQCYKFGSDRTCTPECYHEFARDNFIDDSTQIELRGPGPLGYGAFLSKKADVIKKGEVFAEYVGELAPLGAGTPYTYEVPGRCAIDSSQAGNWTRFINSHCNPNVSAWGDSLGRRHVLLLQARKDIHPGEEPRSNYGGCYFRTLGIKCKCDAKAGEHMPR